VPQRWDGAGASEKVGDLFGGEDPQLPSEVWAAV